MALTEIGKHLRKMRIDAEELLGSMAEKLGYSSGYLSSIETGARGIPDDFVKKLTEAYGLDDRERAELEAAVARTKGSVEVTLGTQTDDRASIETAVMFARDFSRLSAEQVALLKELLMNFEASGEQQHAGSAR